MNAYEMFSKSLSDRTGQPALIDGVREKRRQISFGELAEKVDSVASQLSASGLRPGDRVLLAVSVSIETYTIMLALLKAGMVIMHVDPAHGTSKIASILQSWPPAAIIATRALLLLRLLMPELRQIPRRFVVGGKSAGAVQIQTSAQKGGTFRTVRRSPADSALLTFTSGSTGEPKPVIRTHGFLKQQMKMLQPIASFRDGDIDYVAMPMFVLFNLANGVTSIIPACDMRHPGRANPEVVLAQLKRERATRIVASPALLERLANFCIRRQIQCCSLRCISTGGGPISPSLPMRLKRVAPGAIVRMVYGSTEAEPIAAVDDREISVSAAAEMRTGAGLLVGKPVNGCAVRIIRSHPGASLGPFSPECFASQCLPDGEIGEIVVQGKHVLSSYADPAKNAQTKIEVDGVIWHRTGDAGYFDLKRRLWLVGRCGAAIKDSRGVVYPFQVEYALSGTPGVRRAALTEKNSQRVLVLEMSGREFETNSAAAANCVARHSIDRIVTVRRIPLDKRHDAKVDYPALSKLLEGRWPRVRLSLVTAISAVFRQARSFCRAIASRCKSTAPATKVEECHLKTRL
jgi:acyl-CoA synthetase (AMP-forming)/AMP-acid ligase II